MIIRLLCILISQDEILIIIKTWLLLFSFTNELGTKNNHRTCHKMWQILIPQIKFRLWPLPSPPSCTPRASTSYLFKVILHDLAFPPFSTAEWWSGSILGQHTGKLLICCKECQMIKNLKILIKNSRTVWPVFYDENNLSGGGGENGWSQSYL